MRARPTSLCSDASFPTGRGRKYRISGKNTTRCQPEKLWRLVLIPFIICQFWIHTEIWLVSWIHSHFSLVWRLTFNSYNTNSLLPRLIKVWYGFEIIGLFDLWPYLVSGPIMMNHAPTIPPGKVPQTVRVVFAKWAMSQFVWTTDPLDLWRGLPMGDIV